jgi:hypothetical protein
MLASSMFRSSYASLAAALADATAGDQEQYSADGYRRPEHRQ